MGHSRAIERRTGDLQVIPGDYQFKAAFQGHAVQRFWHQVRFQESLRALEPRSGDKILDVGCGSGVFADMLAQVAGTDVTAVDANPGAIEFGSRKFQRSNLKFRLGLVDELHFAPASFDKISFLEVIEHIPTRQAEQVLKTFHELLKPGGRLVISTPNRNSLWPLIEKMLDRFGPTAPMEEEQHVKIYDRKALASLVEACGFELVSAKSIFTLSPWLAWPVRFFGNFAHTIENSLDLPSGALLIQSFQVK